MNSDLRQRSLTAMALVFGYVILLFGLDSKINIAIFLLLGLILIRELSALLSKATQGELNILLASILMSVPLILFSVVYLSPCHCLSADIPVLSIFILAFVFIFLSIFKSKDNLSKLSLMFRALLPAFYFAAGIYSFMYLLEVENAAWIFVWLTSVVAVNDTAAYFIGRAIGKTPLAIDISPNKTLEGSLAGVFFATACGYFLFFLLDKNALWYVALLFSILVSVAAVFGDLLQSYLKRLARVKDSGNILPGHGGFLDRTDALMFCCPLVILYLYF